MLGWDVVLSRPQERFAMQLTVIGPDSRSGLIIADFTILFASLVAALEYGDFVKVIGISCRDALPVWMGFRACFFETGALSACLAFSIPLDSPRGKRGIVWSGNRWLRFGIRDDNGRILLSTVFF